MKRVHIIASVMILALLAAAGAVFAADVSCAVRYGSIDFSDMVNAVCNLVPVLLFALHIFVVHHTRGTHVLMPLGFAVMAVRLACAVAADAVVRGGYAGQTPVYLIQTVRFLCLTICAINGFLENRIKIAAVACLILYILYNLIFVGFSGNALYGVCGMCTNAVVLCYMLLCPANKVTMRDIGLRRGKLRGERVYTIEYDLFVLREKLEAGEITEDEYKELRAARLERE